MRINPELPWGSWMRIEVRGGRAAYIDDETGETWPSLRAALWNGRLSMPDYNREPSTELLELIHAVLAAAVRRTPGFREQQDDLFEGSMLLQRLFHLWLCAVGFATPAENGHGVEKLTPEGHAVLLMLMATRPHDVRQSPPSAATVAQLVELGLGPEDREVRFERLEREAARWDAAFLRRDEGGRPAVILSKRGSGAMPVLQTVWSLSFDTVGQRDRFYEWLCRRLDRWQAWGDLASEFGSTRLTHRLLGVIAASLEDGQPAGRSTRSGLPPP